MTKNALILLLIALLAGCANDEDFNECSSSVSTREVHTIKISDNTIVTSEMAKRVAQDVFSRHSRAETIKDVESIETVNDAKNQPVAYIINFKENSGFIIVSASMYYTPVIAYSDYGHFDLNLARKSGAMVLLDGEFDRIEHIEELPDSIRMQYNAAWEKYNIDYRVWDSHDTRSSGDVYSLISRNISAWEAQGYSVYMLEDYFQTQEFASLPSETQDRLRNLPTGYANSNYGGIYRTSFALVKHIGILTSRHPILTTEWHQHSPYNAALQGQDTRLGCVTVAMGQVMNYNGYPSFGNSDSSVAQTLAEIRTRLGHPITDTTSSADYNDAIQVFRHYGYNDSHVISHNTDSIKNNLLNNKPVMMFGAMYDPVWPFGVSKHAWVCDGFYYIQNNIEVTLMCLEDCPDGYEPREFFSPYTYSDILNASTTMYHMNWGYIATAGINETNLNGYYSDENISYIDYNNEEHNYNTFRKEIVNIHH